MNSRDDFVILFPEVLLLLLSRLEDVKNVNHLLLFYRDDIILVELFAVLEVGVRISRMWHREVIKIAFI